MDSGIGIASGKRDDWRLLDEVFESKLIKRGGKILFQQFKAFTQTFKHTFQTNNNYTTTPTTPNPYISRKLNNMDEAQVMKKE